MAKGPRLQARALLDDKRRAHVVEREQPMLVTAPEPSPTATPESSESPSPAPVESPEPSPTPDATPVPEPVQGEQLVTLDPAQFDLIVARLDDLATLLVLVALIVAAAAGFSISRRL